MNHESPIFVSASTVAPQVDNAMLALLIVCGFIFLLVFMLMFVFCIMYRKGSPHSRKFEKTQNLALEWGWTIATLVVFLGIFLWGIIIFFKMHIPMHGSSLITVVAKQWMWKFQHENGKREINELHIPLGQPIVLNMASEDVIHSLYIPAFRIKQDVLPGRYTKTWFEASKIGEYLLYCTQYCGSMHADMVGKVYVMSDEDYEKWLLGKESQPIQPILENPISRGEKKFVELACNSCHTEAPASIGPPLRGIVGKKLKLVNGKTIVADENYIRESILYPDAKIPEGYQPVMPSYFGRVNEDDLFALIAYIKSL
jgi:cytochrome c oxidase subunit 2